MITLSFSGPAPADSGIVVAPVPAHVDGRLPTITSGYLTTSRPDHLGVDIMYLWRPGDPKGHPLNEGRGYMPDNVPALAVGHGAVRYWKDYGNGLGMRVDLDSGVQVDYLHLARVLAQKGQRIVPGQPIGIIGHNGGVNHLHFQVLVSGAHVDPRPYVEGAKVLARVPPTGGVGLGTLFVLATLAGAGYAIYRWTR